MLAGAAPQKLTYVHSLNKGGFGWRDRERLVLAVFRLVHSELSKLLE